MTPRLQVLQAGEGPAMVFQHGLGGDVAQVAEHRPVAPGWGILTLECRAHGGCPPGTVRPFSIAMFADDVMAACDARGLDRFVVGGISMGAALALRIAALHPGRVAALVLVRPAWALSAAPPNMAVFAEVAALLRAHPPAEARETFAASPTAGMLARQAPDNLASLLRFFDRPDPGVTADLLADIAADGPGVTPAQVADVDVPALVIGHDIDHVHPMATATELAGMLSGADLVQVTPKASDKPRHIAEIRAAIGGFLEHAAIQERP